MIRAALQLSANAFAAGTLFVAIAASATNLSELPLKPSVLAKPNVIFGMDDSGSMDSEVMLYNNDGAMWWNFTNRNGWGIDAAHPNPSLRTLTTTWFNAAGNATAAWRKMIYLFPNGTGTGNRVYNDGANDHFAILPTSQFAFLRWSGIRKNADGSFSPAPSAPVDSPMHNPLYYNPLITYQPWAPARIGNMASDVFMDGAANDATPATTRSHPLNGITGTNYSGGTGTFNLSTTRAANQTANHVFTALPGMTIPAGSTKLVCDSNNGSGPGAGGCAAAWVAVAADEVVPANQVVWVAMEYRPATVWVREACTVDAAVSVGVADCAAIPSGGTLKRYEITSAGSYNWGSVSRTGTQELQNFANWFQFFRKRKLMLAAAMGDTLENLTGMRLGVAPFNALPGTVRLFDADATTNSTNRFRVSGEFYNANGSGGTPTRETLNHIGLQYQRTDTTDGGVIQFACQRNNAFIVTDGFANASGSPTLATLATTYYNTNPRPTLETGKVRPTPLDPNTNLHVNTYGLTLGARGTLFFGEDSVPPVNAGDWPVPNQNRNPTAVDDLWRATINGKGRMYLANTPEETASRVKAGLDDIRNEQGAQGGVAVSAVNLSRSDGKAYLGYYNPRGWVGDLEARDVDRETAQIKDTSRWRAEDRLTTLGWSNRKVYSATGGVGLDFTAANFGTLLTANAAERTAMVDYLRGNRSGEGQTWRLRYGLLGPVINSEPVISREDSSVIFLASSEGQLHAFDTTTGSEIWAFVPPGNWTDLAASTRRNWTFKTLLDATPVVAKADNGAALVRASRGQHAHAHTGRVVQVELPERRRCDQPGADGLHRRQAGDRQAEGHQQDRGPGDLGLRQRSVHRRRQGPAVDARRRRRKRAEDLGHEQRDECRRSRPDARVGTEGARRHDAIRLWRRPARQRLPVRHHDRRRRAARAAPADDAGQRRRQRAADHGDPGVDDDQRPHHRGDRHRPAARCDRLGQGRGGEHQLHLRHCRRHDDRQRAHELEVAHLHAQRQSRSDRGDGRRLVHRTWLVHGPAGRRAHQHRPDHRLRRGRLHRQLQRRDQLRPVVVGLRHRHHDRPAHPGSDEHRQPDLRPRHRLARCSAGRHQRQGPDHGADLGPDHRAEEHRPAEIDRPWQERLEGDPPQRDSLTVVLQVLRATPVQEPPLGGSWPPRMVMKEAPMSSPTPAGGIARLVDEQLELAAARIPALAPGAVHPSPLDHEEVVAPHAGGEAVLLGQAEASPEMAEELAVLESAPPLSDEELERQALADGGGDADPATPE